MKKINLLVISSMLFSTMILGPLEVLAVENDEVKTEINTDTTNEIDEEQDGEFDRYKDPLAAIQKQQNEEIEEITEENEHEEAEIAEVMSGENIGTRSVVQVSNYTEFATAMRTPSVTEIQLTAPLTANANIANIPVRDIVIHGNGNRVKMSTYLMTAFEAGNGSVTFNDIIFEGVKGADTILLEKASTWSFNFSGSTLEYIKFDTPTSRVTFSGTNGIEVSKAPGHNVKAFIVQDFIIAEDSDLTMIIPKGTGGALILGTDNFVVGKNAIFNFGKHAVAGNIAGNSYAVMGFKTVKIEENAKVTLDMSFTPFFLNETNMTIAKGAVLENVSPTASSIWAYYNSTIRFNPGSSFISKSSSSAVNLNTSSVLTFDQPKLLEMENTLDKKVFTTAGTTQIHFNNVDVSAWSLTTDHNTSPQYIWEDLVLSGRKGTGAAFYVDSSNNSDATVNFKPDNLSKINGKGHGYVESVSLTINEVTDKDMLISGTATPKAEIKLTIEGRTYTTTADNGGNYSVTLDKKYPGGTVVDGVATLSGVIGKATTTILDKTAPEAPTLNSLKDTSTEATGKTEANAVVIITVEGNEIGRGKADSNGDYTITIPAQKENTKVSAQAIDAANNASEKTTVIVSGTAIDNPTINEVTDQDTVVNGQAPANSKITLTIPMPTGGEMTYRGDTDADGNYSIKIAKQKEGTEITVVATKDGKTSAPVKTTVIGTVLAAPTLNQVTDQDLIVTGTAPAHADVILTILGVTYQGKATESGTYSIGIPKQKAGTVIEAIAKQDGKTSSTVNTTVLDKTAPEAPTIEELNEESTIAKGQAEAGSTVILTVDGKEIGRGQADKDGNYSITIAPQPSGKVVKATATDEAGNKSKESSTTVQAVSQVGELTANDYEVKPVMDTNITGTFTGDIKSLLTSVERNGVVTEFAGGTLKSDGTYQIYAWNKIQTVNDKVIVYGLDKNGKRIAQASVTVKDNTIPVVPGKVSFTKVDDFILGSSTTIEAEYEGTIAYVQLIVDGKTYKGGTLKNQTVSFYAWDKISSTTLPVELVAYSTDGSIVARTKVKVITPMPIGTITPDSFNYKTQTFVTGTYTGDVKKVNLVVDGTTYTGGSIKGGKVSFYAWNKITNDKQVVELVGLDSTDKELDRQLVSLEEVIGKGTITPAVFTVGTDGYLTGTYTGDVKAVRLVVDGTSYAGGSVVDGKISFYAFDKIRSTNQEVFIEGYDVSGNKIYSTKVTVNDPLTGKLSLRPFNFAKDTSIKGSYTGQVSSLKTLINDVEVIGGSLKDGELSIYVWNKIPSKGSKVEVVALAKNGKELDRQTLVIQ